MEFKLYTGIVTKSDSGDYPKTPVFSRGDIIVMIDKLDISYSKSVANVIALEDFILLHNDIQIILVSMNPYAKKEKLLFVNDFHTKAALRNIKVHELLIGSDIIINNGVETCEFVYPQFQGRTWTQLPNKADKRVVIDQEEIYKVIPNNKWYRSACKQGYVSPVTNHRYEIGITVPRTGAYMWADCATRTYRLINKFEPNVIIGYAGSNYRMSGQRGPMSSIRFSNHAAQKSFSRIMNAPTTPSQLKATKRVMGMNIYPHIDHSFIKTITV